MVENSEALNPANTPNRCVLVVEDDDDSRTMLCELIAARGDRALGAANAQEAMDAALTSTWDIALIDLHLPEVDGYEIARRLRAVSDGRPRRLIALTGRSDQASRLAAHHAGFDDFIVKPVPPEKLFDLLRRP